MAHFCWLSVTTSEWCNLQDEEQGLRDVRSALSALVNLSLLNPPSTLSDLGIIRAVAGPTG